MTGLLSTAPSVDPASIDEIFWGCANEAGEDDRNVGRMAGLLAGLPVEVPATTVNRLFGSSLDAAMQASRAVETGDAQLAIAGGEPGAVGRSAAFLATLLRAGSPPQRADLWPILAPALTRH
jgi:acetyl-CoA acetyltransferase